MVRLVRVSVVALLVGLGACDDEVNGAPLCDGSACAQRDGASEADDAEHPSGHDPGTAPAGSGADASESNDTSDAAGSDDAATPGPELACETASDCRAPADLGECQKPACIDGRCIVIDDDDALPEDDGNQCTEESCSAGAARHQPEPPGTVCSQEGGDFCDGDGACVECVLPSHCTSDVCQDGECRPAPCGNGELDPAETDVDCGGECGGCGPDEMCAVDADCLGHECPAGSCVPNCDDGVQNHGESDVDCGAVCPSASCEDGDACGSDADCASDYCAPTDHCATPSCSDGFKNGTETQIDCGGMTHGVNCPACPIPCTDNWECGDTAVCYDGFCTDEVNGCTIAGSMDFTNMVTASQTAPITISFGDPTPGSNYEPRCIKVTMGTKIRFEGDFTEHPLVGGIVDGIAEEPASTGPFTLVTDTGTSKDFVMDDCAAYPYYCDNHGSFGMTGAVIVLLP